MIAKHNEIPFSYFKKIRKAVSKYEKILHSRNSLDDKEGKDLMGCDRSTQWNVIVAIKKSNYEDHVGDMEKMWIL